MTKPIHGETEPYRMPLEDWVKERYENCLCIARGKTDPDRAGWLDDACYFKAILEILEAVNQAAKYYNEHYPPPGGF